MTQKNNAYLKGFIPLFVLLSLFACKKEQTDIGVNLRPDGGAINGVQVNITDIICRTVPEDSIRTDSLRANMLGAINDPLFGPVSASIVCQPRLPSLGYDFSGASLDSVTLKLKYFRLQSVGGVEQPIFYGDLDDELSIDVFKVTEDLDPDMNYFSNSTISMGDKIGTYTGRFLFNDSVEVKTPEDTFMTGPELCIRLDDAFGTDLLSQASVIYASQEDFLDYLKGIALVPQQNQASGEGVMAGIDVANSGSVITLYYNGGESKEFIFDGSSERISLYDVSNPHPDIQAQINGSGHFNTTYAQSMGGAKIKIDIPGLDSIITKGEDVVINEAKIRFKIKDGTATSDYPASYRVLLLQPDPEDGSNEPFIDFIDAVSPLNEFWFASNNYGGLLEDGKYYEFHFNRFLLQLIQTYNKTGVNEFDGFYFLIPSDFPITNSRVVLDTDISNGGVQVSVSYTKLN